MAAFNHNDIGFEIQKALPIISPALKDLRTKRLFITGSTGFFGVWLVGAIHFFNSSSDDKIEVCCLTRDKTLFLERYSFLKNDPSLNFIEGDIRNFDFPNFSPTHVLHLATTSAHETYSGQLASEKFDVLVSGTKRLLDFCKQRQVKRILFTSSGAAYSPKEFNTSSNAKEPGVYSLDLRLIESALGQGKKTAEFLFSLYAQENDAHCAVARCFSFVGPGLPLNLHYAIGNFLSDVLSNQPIKILGDGQAIRSYMHIADAINWLLFLLQNVNNFDIVNVGSDTPISMKALAEKLKTLSDSKHIIEISGLSKTAIGNPERNIYVPSVEKAKLVYNLTPTLSLDKALEDTYNFYLKKLGNYR